MTITAPSGAGVAGAAFLLYASASLLWSPDSVYGSIYLSSLAIAFTAGAFMPDLRFLWVILSLFLSANVLVALTDLGIEFGAFGNANFLGCALALGLAGAIGYRVWWFVPLGIVGVAYTQSRTAMIGAGMVILLALPWRWKVVSLIGLILAIFLLHQVRGTGDSNLARLGVWQDTLNHLTLWGRGFGSFEEAYQAFAVKTNMTGLRPTHAYNDYIELTFMLGLGAIPLWIMVILLMEVRDPARLIAATGLIMSLTYYPLFVPVVGHLVACSFGHLYRKRTYHAIPS